MTPPTKMCVCGHHNFRHRSFQGSCESPICGCDIFQEVMTIFIVGPPCAGKTTITKYLFDAILYPVLSAGDVARELSETSERTQIALRRGDIAPEDLMNELMVKKLITRQDRPLIVDGYPRYWEQMADILRFISPPHYFINISAHEDCLIVRNKARDRYDAEVHYTRYDFYLERTLPMITWLQDKGICLDIINDGQDFIGIGEDINQIIQHLKRAL